VAWWGRVEVSRRRAAGLRGGRLVEHDRDKPPTVGGGTLVSGHTWVARSGHVIEVGGRQIIRCTTAGCEPVRSGQISTGALRLGVGGVGGTHLPDGWTRSPGLASTGPDHRPHHPTGECRSRNKPACHSKDNPEECQPFREPDPSREQTNRTSRPRVSPHNTVSAPKHILPAGYGWL
jgi:hypothetical protein